MDARTAFRELLQYKTKFEKKYLTVTIVYFLVLLSLVFLLQNKFPAYYSSFPVKFAILFFVILSLAVHYILKMGYFVTNKKFAEFLKQKLNDDNTDFSQEYINSMKDEVLASEEYTEREKLTITKTLDKLLA